MSDNETKDLAYYLGKLFQSINEENEWYSKTLELNRRNVTKLISHLFKSSDIDTSFSPYLILDLSRLKTYGDAYANLQNIDREVKIKHTQLLTYISDISYYGIDAEPDLIELLINYK